MNLLQFGVKLIKVKLKSLIKKRKFAPQTALSSFYF